MKMKKIFAAMAATVVSAASFAAMSVSTASAADVVAVATLSGQAGTYYYWGEGDNSGNVTAKNADIDGNAQYEAVWDITGDGTGSIEFLIVEIKGTTEKFTSDTYPDLSVTVDEVYIDGVAYDFTQNAAATNMRYYESEDKSGTRIYLSDTWGISDGGDLGVAKETAVTSQIKVVFTVGGLYNEGTSNVTATVPVNPTDPTDPTTEGGNTTTAAQDGNSDDTTTTTTKGGTTTTAKNGSSGATTTKAASNGGKTETSAATGDAGVGIAVAALALAGTAAFAAKKRK